MDVYIFPALGTILAIVTAYYYFKMIAKPKKLPSVAITSTVLARPSLPKPKTVIHDNDNDEESFEGPNMSVFYYSQTGTAQEFATRMANEGKQYGLHTKLYDVEDYDTENFVGNKHSLIVFCAATYGEGDPPENAVQFHEWLMSEDLEENLLSGSRYGVFGLGDKTYDNFNKIGKIIYKRLKKLGAEPLCDRGTGDADGDIEEDFVSWKAVFWKNAVQLLNLGKKKETVIERQTRLEIITDLSILSDSQKNNLDKVQHWISTPRASYEMKNPYLADILENKELHSTLSERSCRHIEIGLAPQIDYEAGDHLGLYPLNQTEEINLLLSRLGQNGNQIIRLHRINSSKIEILGPCKLFTAFQAYYDILSPVRKPLLAMLVQYTTDSEQRKRLELLASDELDLQHHYNKYILQNYRTLYEVLQEYDSCSPPLDHLLELLPKLQPRYYSISSSSILYPKTAHITVALVKNTSPTNRTHRGVATTFLSSQLPLKTDGDTIVYPKVPIFIRHSAFKPPKSLSTPIILVGPGTGIAPFRGFLQERIALSESNKTPLSENILFFGCRHPDHDFVYKDELEKMAKDGKITLHVAFSRISEKKLYVQDLMSDKDISRHIYDLIKNHRAHFYICGDAKNMSRDVNNTLKQILINQGDSSEVEVDKYIKNMKSSERFMSDVW